MYACALMYQEFGMHSGVTPDIHQYVIMNPYRIWS